MLTFFFIAGSYIIGSLSAAIIICKLLGFPDPRHSGSRNPGATNVLRIAGKKIAALVLFGDALKGFIPVMLARFFELPEATLALVALAALLGHTFPFLFRFEGGKGIATAGGAFLALSPVLTLVGFITWLTVAFYSRISSLAAVVTITLVPMYVIILHQMPLLMPLVVISLLILWRHQDNIKRLINNTEPRVDNK